MINKKYNDYINKFLNSDNVQDPLFLTFSLRFDFFRRLRDDGVGVLPGLLTGDAREYLNDNNDSLRVQKLDYFISLLRKFSIEEPWVFSELSGVDSLFTIDNKKGIRVGNDIKITVSALENIEMRTLSFIEAYRSVVNDKVFMRTILPRNLKRFDMYVYLVDPRVLVKYNRDKRILEYDDDSQGIIVLKLEDCEFQFNNLSFTGSLTTNPNTMITHKFDILVGRVYETYNLPTKLLFGYGGLGYFANDLDNEYNPLNAILRPKTMVLAEVGNERNIVDETIEDLRKVRRNLVSIGQETVEPEKDDLTVLPKFPPKPPRTIL
jgi:hypothetical protein